jgi:KDO2-lipid IV(A) lauroyltransferase
MAHYGPVKLWSMYVAARLSAAAVGAFPIDANLDTAALIGRTLHNLDKRHRKRAEANIAVCFPEWSKQRVARVARQGHEHLVRLAFEVIQTPRIISPHRWADRVRVRNLGPAIEILGSSRPAILVTGHLGNWEVLGYYLAVMGFDVDAIARPLDHKLINDWLLGIREARGMRIITKWDATERMLAVLNRGGALGFIADQNAGEKGLFVPFFGRLASSYKSIGLLALNHDAPIICGYAHRVGPGFRYEIGTADIIYPDDWADQRDPLYYVTARYNRAMETMIRQRPEQYLWTHRRWKSRPRHERQQKPIPPALRRNLEDLPWMTDDLMQRLENPPDMEERLG